MYRALQSYIKLEIMLYSMYNMSSASVGSISSTILPRLAGGHGVDRLQVRRVRQHRAVHRAPSTGRQVHGDGYRRRKEYIVTCQVLYINPELKPMFQKTFSTTEIMVVFT